MTLILAAAALIAAAACTNDDNAAAVDNAPPVPVRIIAGVGTVLNATPTDAAQPGTRAMDDHWNRDHIGVIVYSSPGSDMAAQYRNAHYVTTSTSATADFTPVAPAHTIHFAESDEPVEFCAYTPYQSSATPDALPGTNGIISIDTRVQTTAEQQEAIDFLFAPRTPASKSNPTVTFSKVDGRDYTFKHILSRLVLKLETPEGYGFAADDVTHISQVKIGGLCTQCQLDIKPKDLTVSGSYTLTLDTDSWLEEWDITDNVNRVETKAGTTQRIYTLIFPIQQPRDKNGDGLSAIPLSITLGGEVYKNDKDITGSTDANGNTGFFKVGTSYEYTVRLKRTGLEVTGATITPWADGGTGSGDATRQ